MRPSYFILVCILSAAVLSEAMRSMRGLQIGAPDPTQQGEAVNPQANEAALLGVMQHDPCWNRPANHPADQVHEADVNCARALAAFNSRNEDQRRRCRWAVAPKCRLFGNVTVMRCCVKKIRPRSHFFCSVFSMRHEVIDLVHCARPLFPNLPHVAPPGGMPQVANPLMFHH